MYYNREEVNRQLEEGVSAPADIVEDLYGFINEIFMEAKDRQVDTELQDLIDRWES